MLRQVGSEQQVDMVGHDDPRVELEAAFLASLKQTGFEDVPRRFGLKQREPLVAGEGQKTSVTGDLVAGDRKSVV